MGSILKSMPSLVLAGLVVLLGSLLAGLFWQLFAPEQESTLVMTEFLEAPPSVSSQNINYGKAIADLNLFGTVDKPVVNAKNPQVVDKPITAKPPLNIILSGVIKRKTRPSMVILQVAGEAESGVYRIGAEVQTGVKVAQIHTREVVLDYEGEKVVIGFPDSKAQKGGQNRAMGRRSSPYIQNVDRSRRTSSRTRSTSRMNTGRTPLPVDNLGELRNVLMNEPHRVGELVNVVEAKDRDQNLIGFRLSPGRNRALFRNLGLRPGDIAIEINGIPLNDREKIFMIMGELSSLSEISLKVKRGNQTITINKSLQ